MHLHPSRSSCWVLGDHFSQCRCVGALAPLPLVLLGSGGLFCLTLVCGVLVPLPPLHHSPPVVASPRHRQMSNGIHPHLCVPTALIRFTARNSLTHVLYITPTLLCVIPHPSWHQGSFQQDCIGVFITGVLEAIRTCPGTQPKAKCSPSSPQGVVILYLCTRHLHRRSSGFDCSFIFFYFYLVSSPLTILYYFSSTPRTALSTSRQPCLTLAPKWLC